MLRWLKNALSQKQIDNRLPTPPGLDIPPGAFQRIYAVGDIHGRLDLLLDMDRRIEADIGDGETALVVYLGDYIDRGPDSRGVIEHLRVDTNPRFRRLCLRGNHDDIFLTFMENPLAEWNWLDLGGRETLRSYGLAIDPYRDRSIGDDGLKDLLRSHVPENHRDFLSGTPLWARAGDFLFVHAGIQPGIALERQEPSDFMWIREPFLSEGPRLPLTVVHGHTPDTAIVFGRNRIGVDTGAYATGRLSAVRIVDGRASEL